MRDSPFHQSASAASLNWRQKSHFRIVISEGGFLLEESAVLLCENRLPSTVAFHPVYFGESVVGSRNCLPALRDSTRIVGESETDLLLPPQGGLIGLVLCTKPPAGV